MKKVVFKNKLFYFILISLIIILIIYNCFIVIKTSNLYGLITVFIEIILLVLIFTKHQYAKLGIVIWAIIALIIGFGFEVIASLMDAFNNDFKILKMNSLLYNLLGLVIGILIIDFTKRTVVIIPSNRDS